MNKIISFLACIFIVLVFVEFLVLSRQSWNVVCWGNHLSTGFPDMLRHRASRYSNFHPGSWYWKAFSVLIRCFSLWREVFVVNVTFLTHWYIEFEKIGTGNTGDENYLPTRKKASRIQKRRPQASGDEWLKNYRCAIEFIWRGRSRTRKYIFL